MFKYFAYVLVLIIFSVFSCSERSTYKLLKSDQFKSDLETLCDTKLYLNNISDIKNKNKLSLDFQSKFYRICLANSFSKGLTVDKQRCKKFFKYRGINVYYQRMCGKPPGYCLYQVIFQHKKASTFISYKIFKKLLSINKTETEKKLFRIPKYLIDALIY